MECCFVEKWCSEYSVPQNCKIIALNNNASHQLDKCGVEHETPADYFTSGEIRGDDDAFLESQLLWIEKFDEFIREIYPETKEIRIGLASLYSRNIKYLVDCVILTSRVLNRLIGILAPTKIYFFPDIYGEDTIYRWQWFHSGESSFMRMIGLICREKNISLDIITAEKGKQDSIQTKKERSDIFTSMILFADAIVRKLSFVNERFLRNVTDWHTRCRFFSINSFFTRKRERYNILIMKNNAFFYDFCRDENFSKDCQKNNFNVIFKNGDRVRDFCLSPFGKSRKISSTVRENNKVINIFDQDRIMSDLVRGDIMKWINEQCGLDVSAVLDSRFRYLLFDLFPETISRVKTFMNFFNRNNIDYILYYSLSEVDDFAAVAAAKSSKFTKTVAFAHGADVFESKIRYYSEYRYSDLYFACTNGEAENMKYLAEWFGDKHFNANEYSHFKNIISSSTSISKRNKYVFKHGKPVILYIPVVRRDRMHMPIQNTQMLQWDYLKWHHALIDYFLSRTDFHFIWKGINPSFEKEDQIFQLLKDRKAVNVDFASDRLHEWLSIADKALCDMPSTAFFECMFKKIPVLALYRPADQKLRKNAYAAYGSSLQPYSTIDEGIQAVGGLLDTDPEKYIVTSAKSNVSAPNIMVEHLAKQKRWKGVGE
jgi:hypothetical protein